MVTVSKGTWELSPNKSFEYAPSGPDALTRAAQFKRYVYQEMKG